MGIVHTPDEHTPDADRMRLGALVQQELDRRQWSALELMRRSGTTQPTVARVLRGLPVRSSTLEQMERGLGWAPGDAQRVLDDSDFVPAMPADSPSGIETDGCMCAQALELVAQAGRLLTQMAELQMGMLASR